MRNLATPFAVLTLATLVGACSPPDAGRPDFMAQAYLDLVAAEDARPAGGTRMDVLVSGTRSPSPELRAVATRGLGRLENPDVLPLIAASREDPSPLVRREVANALAQAVHGGDGDAALPFLLAMAAAEDDPGVRGAVARSLGRIAVTPVHAREVGRTLVALSRGPAGDAPPYQMEGTVLGMLRFTTRLRGEGVPSAVVARLEELTRYGIQAPAADRGAHRVRGAAAAAYATMGLPAEEVERLLQDPADEVRRVAATRLRFLDAERRTSLALRALADPSPQVRLEGVRVGVGLPPLTAEACERLVAVADGDGDPHVRLAAVDALARPCPRPGDPEAALARWATGLEGAPSDWHLGAHALAALASLAPARARPLVSRHAGHGNPFARMWVATAAARAGDQATLATLAGDTSPNVRTAALRGLHDILGREADPALIQAMGDADDNQLLLTVAELLRPGGANPLAAEAALTALERVSQSRMETMRDARVALLTLVETAGDASLVPRVEPYLRDYDPAVAREASRVLGRWTGRRWIDAPRGSPRLPLPTPAELREMEEVTLAFHMARGGSIRVRLLPWQAPTNAVRLLRMAREGTLDGLTLHRVVPNFVLQGGSPGANEYAGHGAFTRDEVGLASNWRGTVGLSTRGRDTGDGQIYLNLVDNLRLDHDYTVYGVVTAGMEVADAVLEGDVIERVEVLH